jgi:hypothetical protein
VPGIEGVDVSAGEQSDNDLAGLKSISSDTSDASWQRGCACQQAEYQQRNHAE